MPGEGVEGGSTQASPWSHPSLSLRPSLRGLVLHRTQSEGPCSRLSAAQAKSYTIARNLKTHNGETWLSVFVPSCCVYKSWAKE